MRLNLKREWKGSKRKEWVEAVRGLGNLNER